jgi:acyl-ACP thioesterase
MIFSEKSTITMHNVDSKGCAKASSILERMQDAANSQLHIYHPSNEELWADHKAFILSRICINFFEPLHAYDEVVAQTWANPSHGYSFNRSLSLLKDGITVANAQSLWALIDTDTHRLLKTDAVTLNFSTEEPLSGDFNLRTRIPEPDRLELLGNYTVTYYDTDQNHHMHNTKYPDFICNFVDMTKRRMSRVSIAFLNEAPMGETLTAYGYWDNEAFYFRSVREDGKINIDAEAKFDTNY